MRGGITFALCELTRAQVAEKMRPRRLLSMRTARHPADGEKAQSTGDGGMRTSVTHGPGGQSQPPAVPAEVPDIVAGHILPWTSVFLLVK